MATHSRAGGGEIAYQVLARELREGILQGRYPEGRLPTEAQLAQSRRLSRQTVRRAFQELVGAGLVHRVPGRGTFVAQREGQYLRQFGSVEDLMGLSLDTDMELVQPLQRRVDVAAAGRLRLDTDVVWTVVFRRLHDQVPFCLTTVHLPPRVGRLLAAEPDLTEPARRSRVTIIGLVDTHAERPIAEAEQSITVATASPAAVAQLGCAAEQQLLHIDRTYLDTAGSPVELAQSEFVPDLYSYRVRLRRAVP